MKNRFEFHSKLLRVDLTREKFSVEDLPSSMAEQGLGGKALGLYLLMQKKKHAIEPLSPSNPIILATGLLTGTGAPTGAWMSLLTWSPLSGLLSASSAGGEFPARLKMAGYDALVIEGRAKEPISIVIDDKIHFLPATSLWGKTVQQTDEYFTSRWGRMMKVLCIGPAGERGYKTATPVMDRFRSSISPGLGAVMGSKNLKAIAVYGEKAVPIADPEKYKIVSSNILEKLSRKFVAFRELSEFGTPNFLPLFNQYKVLPTRNFRSGEFEKAEEIDGRALKDRLSSRRIACFSCPIGCRKLSKWNGEYVEGPDFTDAVSFGSLCGNSEPSIIQEARRRCNALGIETYSMGGAIASAMDLFSQGVIKEDEAGFPLNFGDGHAILHLLDQVEKGNGMGKLLAEDPIQVARRHLPHDPIFHVRNQPVGPSHPVHDPYMDLHYRVSTSGAWYLLGALPFSKELNIYDQFHPKDEVACVRLLQDTMAILESLGLCEYLLLFLNLNEITSLLSPIIGLELDTEMLLQVGEKVVHMERHLNNAWNGKNALLSAPPSWSSQAKDERVMRYFALRNWDENGVPKSRPKL